MPYANPEDRRRKNREKYLRSRERRLAYAKEYRARNKARIAAWCESHKEAKREYDREYRKRNKERRKECYKRYLSGHKKSRADYQREWRKRNPEKVKEQNRRDYERVLENATLWSKKRKKDRVRHAKKNLEKGLPYRACVSRRIPEYMTRIGMRKVQSPQGLVVKGMIYDALNRGVQCRTI